MDIDVVMVVEDICKEVVVWTSLTLPKQIMNTL